MSAQHTSSHYKRVWGTIFLANSIVMLTWGVLAVWGIAPEDLIILSGMSLGAGAAFVAGVTMLRSAGSSHTN